MQKQPSHKPNQKDNKTRGIITSLELTNFQGHGASKISFGSTTIVKGQNYHNKSAITKALRILLLGESFPKSCIKHGTKKSTIKVTFTDGKYISIDRNKTTQITTMGKPDGTTSVSTGSRDIREDLRRFSGFDSFLLDPSDIITTDVQIVSTNSPRLPGNRRSETLLRIINNLSGNACIELAKQQAKKELATLSANNTFLQDRIANLEEKSKLAKGKLKIIEELIELNSLYAELQTNCNQVANQHTSLLFLIEKCKNKNRTLTELKTYENLLELKGELENKNKEIVLVQNKIQETEYNIKLLARKTEIENELETLTHQLSVIPKCNECGRELN